jgi:putative adhesin
MRTRSLGVGVLILATLAIAAPAAAQRFPFERTYDVGASPVIDVSTTRGKINVRTGEAGRVVVSGATTVRLGLTTPSNAVELARKVAANPPIDQSGDGLRLRSPLDPDEGRAMTVNYDLRVPPNARVIAVSDSGAIEVRDVAGHVEVRTQSSAISLMSLASADVETGSGAVRLDGATGAIRISTSSSGITARDLRGGLRTRTESGRTILSGSPSSQWDVSAGSGSIEVDLYAPVNATLHATTGSGTVYTPDRLVTGSIERQRVEGAIGTGGPVVRLASRSGSIRVR